MTAASKAAMEGSLTIISMVDMPQVDEPLNTDLKWEGLPPAQTVVALLEDDVTPALSVATIDRSALYAMLEAQSEDPECLDVVSGVQPLRDAAESSSDRAKTALQKFLSAVQRHIHPVIFNRDMGI